jgi:hypothetical protein
MNVIQPSKTPCYYGFIRLLARAQQQKKSENYKIQIKFLIVGIICLFRRFSMRFKFFFIFFCSHSFSYLPVSNVCIQIEIDPYLCLHNRTKHYALLNLNRRIFVCFFPVFFLCFRFCAFASSRS